MFAATIIVLVSALAGCTTTGSSLISQISGQSKPIETATASQSAPSSLTATGTRAKVSIAPVIGAPDAVAKQLATQLRSEAAQRRIAVASGTNDKFDYLLRGYIVAARETTGTKVSYIWDVTNPAGARVHRITGEELVKGAGAGDPWTSVSQSVIQTIASKTGQSLDTWLPQKTGATAPAAAKPIAPIAPIAKKTSAPPTTRVASRTATPAAPSTGSSPTTTVATGSIAASSSPNVIVPSVTGAPGDGPTSLAAALRQELSRNGVKPATSAGTRTYRVEGRVALGATNAGQQPIKIDWVVKDPKGRRLGTVSQENKIPAGSLNGNWGPTANAAATAAAQGILKLMPKR